MHMLHRYFFRLIGLLLIALSIQGCTTITYKQMNSVATGTKHIAVFFDGTHNNIASDTNIKRLHSLVSLRDNPDIATIYIEGVGVGGDVLGMGTGWGIGERVRIAYEFILNNYCDGDKIYIFGFSRGAYSARILTSLLYYAGLPKDEKLSSREITLAVYDAVKNKLTDEKEPDRRKIVTSKLQEQKLNVGEPVSVDVLGLWDTVEALGFPDWAGRLENKAEIAPFFVDVDIPNKHHGDQLCNVRQAYQALAIDDNREWVFTPLLLSRKALF
jgi:uncharacterized protein (DUF2235 family)